MTTLQATEYAIYATQRTVSGMRTNINRKRTAPWYSIAIINEDGSVLDVRSSWDLFKLLDWAESFGLDISIDRAIL